MTESTWPFAPGDVVRDSGEDGDDTAWLRAAPAGTVVTDSMAVEWTKPGPGKSWLADGGAWMRRSERLSEFAPVVVVSVGSES
jgi:hypothetical protein